MMDRRGFIRIVGGTALAWSFAARAQQSSKIPQIGYLGFFESSTTAAFQKGLHDLGYVEGKNIHVIYRFAGGSVERLAAFANELTSLKVDVIVAASTQSIVAAKRATSIIPIVFPVTFDPVQSGYVASLARPGGNLTGLSPLNPEVAAKRVELLREIIPRISRVAVLRDPTNPGSLFVLQETAQAAERLNIRLVPLEARNLDELEAAFSAAVEEQAGAMMVVSDNLFFTQQKRIIDLGTRNRLLQMFETSNFVAGGGLISYGADLAVLYERAATYVDKILKGAKPGELPVEQATRFELAINMKTSRALGLTVPNSLILRADDVIQ